MNQPNERTEARQLCADEVVEYFLEKVRNLPFNNVECANAFMRAAHTVAIDLGASVVKIDAMIAEYIRELSPSGGMCISIPISEYAMQLVPHASADAQEKLLARMVVYGSHKKAAAIAEMLGRKLTPTEIKRLVEEYCHGSVENHHVESELIELALQCVDESEMHEVYSMFDEYRDRWSEFKSTAQFTPA